MPNDSMALLVGFALFMAIESIERIANPVAIGLDYAIGVAVLGLIVNGSRGLLRQTTRVLLGRQCTPEAQERVRAAIETGTEDRATDLHLWSAGARGQDRASLRKPAPGSDEVAPSGPRE